MTILPTVSSTDANDVVLDDKERQPCEVWTRVMGYFRPYSEYNKGKKSEFRSRKCFTEKNAVAHMELEDACSCHAEAIAAE